MSSSSPPSSPSRLFELKTSAAPFVPSFSLPPSSSQLSSPLPSRHTNHRPAHPQSAANVSPSSLAPAANTSPQPSPSSRPKPSPPSSPSSARLSPHHSNISLRPSSAGASKSGDHRLCTSNAGIEANTRASSGSNAAGTGKKGRDRGEVLTNIVEFQFSKKDEPAHSGTSSLPSLSAHEKRQLKAAAAWRREYKELYVVAQCSIVFRSCGDDVLVPYTALSDECVNWSHVQYTRLLADAPVKCPLCLGETICPRISECGHVYCTLCLLQMFSVNAKHKVACPICLVPFHMTSTKPIAITVSNTNAAFTSSSPASPSSLASLAPTTAAAALRCVSFALLQRWRGNNCPVLVPHSLSVEQAPATLHAVTSVHAPYCKFLISCHDDAAWAAMEANAQGTLLRQLIIDEECSDADLVKRFLLTKGSEGAASIVAAEAAAAAVAAAAERDRLMKSAFPPLLNPSAFSPPSSSLPSSLPSSSSSEPPAFHPASFVFPSSPLSPIATESEAEVSPDNVRSWASARLKDTMRYVFAQACDGSLVFMQPINARMLLHHIAATGCIPALDSIPVVHSANVTVDDDSRSRYKWMAHLPLFTAVVIVDVDLSAIVGVETMQAFKQELQHRSLRWAQPVATTDEVKSAPPAVAFPVNSSNRTNMRDGAAIRGRTAAADASSSSAAAAAYDDDDGDQVESDARFAMQLSLQEHGGVHDAFESDDFPLIRSVSEGGGGGAAAAGVWSRGRASGGQLFPALAGSSYGDAVSRRKSSGAGRGEVKVPVPAVPQAPKGAWGKK